jgi:hypothetical protein
MSPRNHSLTIAALERCVSDSTKPEKLRRSASLRLSRLRAAVKRPAATTRTTAPSNPAALPVPTEKARYEALQSFLALCRQRTALHRKRRSTGEQGIFNAMVALMPATAPTCDDPQQWRDFIARVSAILEEIKTAKTL